MVAPIAPAHLLDQRGVEARAPAQRRREDRRLPGGQPGEALLVHQGRDAEPAGGMICRWLRATARAPIAGSDRRRAERPGELAEPVDGSARPSRPARRRTRAGAAPRSPTERRRRPRRRRAARPSPRGVIRASAVATRSPASRTASRQLAVLVGGRPRALIAVAHRPRRPAADGAATAGRRGGSAASCASALGLARRR